ILRIEEFCYVQSDLLGGNVKKAVELRIEKIGIVVVESEFGKLLRPCERRLARADGVVQKLILDLLHLSGRRAVDGEIAYLVHNSLADRADVLVGLRDRANEDARRAASLVRKT